MDRLELQKAIAIMTGIPAGVDVQWFPDRQVLSVRLIRGDREIVKTEITGEAIFSIQPYEVVPVLDDLAYTLRRGYGEWKRVGRILILNREMLQFVCNTGNGDSR